MPEPVPLRNVLRTQFAGRHMPNQYYSRFDSNKENNFNSCLNSRGKLRLLPIVT